MRIDVRFEPPFLPDIDECLRQLILLNAQCFARVKINRVVFNSVSCCSCGRTREFMRTYTQWHVTGLPQAVALLAFLVFVVGCAVQAPSTTGFLGDRADLRPDRYGNPGLLWYERPGFDWKQYKRVMLDPVVIYLHPQAQNRGLAPDALKKLADEFRDIVVAELGSDFPVTNQPGGDVLRIRAAITDVVPASPALNVLTTAVAFVPMDMGGASLEAEFLDSLKGDRLAAMAETKRGTPLDLKGGFTELGHARSAMKQWAKDLKNALQRGP